MILNLNVVLAKKVLEKEKEGDYSTPKGTYSLENCITDLIELLNQFQNYRKK